MFTESFSKKLTNRSLPRISLKNIFLKNILFAQSEVRARSTPKRNRHVHRPILQIKKIPTTSYSICLLHYFRYSSNAIICKHCLLLSQSATVIFIAKSNEFASQCSVMRYRLNVFICDYINTIRKKTYEEIKVIKTSLTFPLRNSEDRRDTIVKGCQKTYNNRRTGCSCSHNVADRVRSPDSLL